MSNAQQELLAHVQNYIKESFANHDASHDFAHVERVRNMAMLLAQQEGITDSQMLLQIELAAWLHDVGDFKYSQSEHAANDLISAFLSKHGQSEDMIQTITTIVKNVSFKNEMGQGVVQFGAQLTKQIAIVQDADRLDAIGAIGIARWYILLF